MNAIKAGFFYFLFAFLIGFILGTLRVTLLVSRLGELSAVILEIPLMLMSSWFISKKILHRVRASTHFSYFAIMGGSAFLFLQLTEYVMAILFFHQTSQQYFEKLSELPGFIGLMAQLVFGIIPLLQSKNSKLKAN